MVGKLTSCNASTTDVDYRWRPYYGVASDCTEFYWPDGMAIPPQDEDDATRCRLTHDEAAQLAAARQSCGMPARISDAQESAIKKSERSLPKDQRTRFHTVSLVLADVDGAPKGFTGMNAQARPMRAQNPASCPGGVTGEWTGVGYTYVGQGGAGAVGNTNSTSGHAEGDALLQLAEKRGRTPAPFGGPDIATGPRQGGCAKMNVDRTPCAASCAPEGISNAAAAAGLDKLFVHSPAGCRVFSEGGKVGGDACNGTERCP